MGADLTSPNPRAIALAMTEIRVQSAELVAAAADAALSIVNGVTPLLDLLARGESVDPSEVEMIRTSTGAALERLAEMADRSRDVDKRERAFARKARAALRAR
jgi:hypothetical protein